MPDVRHESTHARARRRFWAFLGAGGACTLISGALVVRSLARWVVFGEVLTRVGALCALAFGALAIVGLCAAASAAVMLIRSTAPSVEVQHREAGPRD